jgi:hypothetical protein
MMRIENYEFGSITIDGKIYKNDVIILPDKVIPEWWRKEGHKLHLVDLPFLEEYTPKLMIVGCGYHGVMKIKPEIKEYCEEHNIKLIAENSRRAVQTFNKMSAQPGVVGMFHLTC